MQIARSVAPPSAQVSIILFITIIIITILLFNLYLGHISLLRNCYSGAI